MGGSVQMDVPAVQAISGDLCWSANRVNDATRRIAGFTSCFDGNGAGLDYTAQGDRVAAGLAGICSRLFMWANCVNDTGAALGSAAAINGQVDNTSAAGIGAIQDVVV